MNNAATEALRNFFNIFRSDSSETNKSRKRTATEDVFGEIRPKQQRLSLKPTLLRGHEPRTYVIPIKKQFSARPFKNISDAYDDMTTSGSYSKFKRIGTAYADIEYSDDDGENDVIFVADQPRRRTQFQHNQPQPLNFGATAAGPRQTHTMNGNSNNPHKSSSTSYRSFFMKTRPGPPPQMIPISRGAMMLNSVPDLNPIIKNRTCSFNMFKRSNFGAGETISTNGGEPNERTGRPFKWRETFEQNNGNFERTKVPQFKRNLNSIVTETRYHDERKRYAELLKFCVPGLYATQESDEPAYTPINHQTSPGFVLPKIYNPQTDDDVIEIKDNSTVSGRSSSNKDRSVQDVTPVNSLKNKLLLTPLCQPEWLAKTNHRYESKQEQRKIDILEQRESLNDLQLNTHKYEQQVNKKLQEFTINDSIVIDDSEDEIEEEDEFPELTTDCLKKIQNSISGNPGEVVVQKFNISITKNDLRTLIGDAWLNDEVINFYMNLLIERSEIRADEGYPKVYAMNTFFIPKLMQGGHGGVRRWTRKVDIFSYDIIPVPVHVGQVHWCMAIIHLANKTIKYYDSMGTPNPRVLNALEMYLRDESMDKRKKAFDTSKFLIESVREVPRQMNGSDCGVFSCMFAEYVSRNKEITFSQEHMPYFRKKMILEIANGRLLL